MPVPVVYTMGKVGSTAMTAAIHAAGLVCFDIHTLDEERITRLSDRRIAAGKYPERHLIESLAIRKMVLAAPANFCFITAVREPIAQAISAFFQNVALFNPTFDIADPSQAGRAIETFHAKYNLEAPLRWFDDEFGRFLKIDVLDPRYAADDAVIEQNGVRILAMRADWPDERREHLISDFIGARIALGRENEATTKKYGAFYRAFTEEIRFTPEKARALYDSRYCRRFWSAEEREALFRRWTAPQRASA